MPALGLLFFIQLAFAIHVVRSGREYYWIYIIMFIPALGCAVYFFTQVLPELGQSRTARRVGSSLLKAVDPERELRRRKVELERADTIENRMKLAEECLEAKMASQAKELLLPALKGPHRYDPHLLLLLARAQFQENELSDARETMESIMRENPGFRSHDGHLLYARILEGMELAQLARAEYQVLAQGYPGEEARVRYAELLLREGELEQARALLQESLERAKRAPKYYQRKEREWLGRARQVLSKELAG